MVNNLNKEIKMNKEEISNLEVGATFSKKTKYKVVLSKEGYSCIGCAFDTGKECKLYPTDPPCLAENRLDNKEVIFISEKEDEEDANETDVRDGSSLCYQGVKLTLKSQTNCTGCYFQEGSGINVKCVKQTADVPEMCKTCYNDKTNTGIIFVTSEEGIYHAAGTRFKHEGIMLDVKEMTAADGSCRDCYFHHLVNEMGCDARSKLGYKCMRFERGDSKSVYFEKVKSKQDILAMNFDDAYDYLRDSDLDLYWDGVNSGDIIQIYISEMMGKGIKVAHILNVLENNPSIRDLYEIWLGNSMEVPIPINTTEELLNALEYHE